MSGTKGKYRLSDMTLDFVSLVAAGDDGMAQVVLSKAAPTDDSQEEHMGEQIAKDDLAPEVVAYIDSLEAEVDTLAEQVEKAEERETELRDTLSKMAPKDEAAQEEINKSLLAKADPALRALIEKQQADLKATEEIAKAEREQRLTREYISKAEALPMLSESKDDLAGLLRRVADSLPAEDVTKWETILKAANEQIAQGNLFASYGTGGGDTTVSKSVEAKADEIMKADSSLTKEQAMVKVYEQNPDLYTAAQEG